MRNIIPAIIPQSRAHLVESLEKISHFTNEVQIDIVDGIFVPPKSWPYVEGETSDVMRRVFDGFDVEVDLMVEEPESVLKTYLDAGVRRVVIHLESTHHLNDIVALVSAYDCMLGLSINNDTDVTTLENVIGVAQYVQLMGIAQIGSQGQPFDTRVLERMTYLKKTYPYLEVSIDGSVNNESIAQLCDAGADRLVVGSAIMNAENPGVVHQALLRTANVE